MSLPESIRVRILSESLDSVGLTPVVSQLMPIHELTATILAVIGKDAARLREILARGSFVSGASRFQWERLSTELHHIESLLAMFPDADPSRPFAAEHCTTAILHGLTKPLIIEREAGSRRRLFRRTSFWDCLMSLAAASAAYKTYSYKERADVYVRAMDEPAHREMQDAAKLLAWSSYEQQIRRGTVQSIELHVPRTGVR